MKSIIEAIRQHRRPWSAEIVTVLIWAMYCSIAMFLPWKHSPDGNVYYLVTLRILQGDFAGSIDGVFSPLLSWLMAIPVFFGVLLPDAYRIVNCLAFGVLLWATSSLGKKFKIPPLLHGMVLVLTAIECTYLSLRSITSDLLTAGLVVLLVNGLVADLQGTRRVRWYWYSVLIALVYLAKAFQLPIVLGSLIASWFFVFRHRADEIGGSELARPVRIGCIIVLALVLCAPWITVLSAKYGAFTLSAQQFIYHRQLPLEYSPFNQPTSASGADIERTSVAAAATSIFNDSLGRIFYALAELRRGAATAVFGEVGLWFFVAMLLMYSVTAKGSPEHAASRRLLWIFGVLPFLFYLPIWGARLRYYLSSLPLLNLLFVCALSQMDTTIRLWSAQKSNRVRRGTFVAYRVLVLLAFLGMLRQSTSYIADDWDSTSDRVVKWAVDLPELRKREGAIAGFDVNDPYPSLIAYALRRPMWFYVGLHMRDGAERLHERLGRERVSQIIVLNGRNAELEGVPGIELVGVFSQPAYSFALYHFGSTVIDP